MRPCALTGFRMPYPARLNPRLEGTRAHVKGRPHGRGTPGSGARHRASGR